MVCLLKGAFYHMYKQGLMVCLLKSAFYHMSYIVFTIGTPRTFIYETDSDRL